MQSGANVWVQGAGSGKFNWTTVEEARKDIPDMFNLVDPPKRGVSFQLWKHQSGGSQVIPDTFTTLPALKGPSWMAVRYHGELKHLSPKILVLT